MSFADAVRSCLSQYVGFSGRARRSEFWWFFLFNVIVGFVAGIIDSILGTSSGNGQGLIAGIASLALLLPNLAVASRRLHDTGRSAWWLLLLLLIIIGWIVLFVFYLLDSEGDNQYGPNPKGGGGFANQPPPQTPPTTA